MAKTIEKCEEFYMQEIQKEEGLCLTKKMSVKKHKLIVERTLQEFERLPKICSIDEAKTEKVRFQTHLKNLRFHLENLAEYAKVGLAKKYQKWLDEELQLIEKQNPEQKIKTYLNAFEIDKMITSCLNKSKMSLDVMAKNEKELDENQVLSVFHEKLEKKYGCLASELKCRNIFNQLCVAHTVQEGLSSIISNYRNGKIQTKSDAEEKFLQINVDHQLPWFDTEKKRFCEMADRIEKAFKNRKKLAQASESADPVGVKILKKIQRDFKPTVDKFAQKDDQTFVHAKNQLLSAMDENNEGNFREYGKNICNNEEEFYKLDADIEIEKRRTLTYAKASYEAASIDKPLWEQLLFFPKIITFKVKDVDEKLLAEEHKKLFEGLPDKIKKAKGDKAQIEKKKAEQTGDMIKTSLKYKYSERVLEAMKGTYLTEKTLNKMKQKAIKHCEYAVKNQVTDNEIKDRVKTTFKDAIESDFQLWEKCNNYHKSIFPMEFGKVTEWFYNIKIWFQSWFDIP